MRVKLRPLNPESQLHLKEKMLGDPHVYVVKRQGDKVLVASVKGCYCAWVSLRGGKNWELVLAP